MFLMWKLGSCGGCFGLTFDLHNLVDDRLSGVSYFVIA